MSVTPFPAALDRAINISQLVALVAGLAWIGAEAGRRDERLAVTIDKVNELAEIVQELTKSQIAGATRAASAEQNLEQLRARVERLETK